MDQAAYEWFHNRRNYGDRYEMGWGWQCPIIAALILLIPAGPSSPVVASYGPRSKLIVTIGFESSSIDTAP